MTRKQWILIIAAVLLGAFSLYLNKDWFAGDPIQLMHRSRPSRGAFRRIGANNPLVDPISFWFDRKVKREESGAGVAAAGTEIDVLLREADRKLKASRAASTTIASMPVIFILGESGSAKTSVILHSGLEPELLAGMAPASSQPRTQEERA